MSTILAPPPESAATEAVPNVVTEINPSTAIESTPNRVRITRAMCESLINNGLLTGRYELIDGEVISKMGQNPPHSYVIMRLTAWLVAVFGIEVVRMQLTMNVPDPDAEINDPLPDGLVTAQPASAYLTRHPGPADVLLLVEVSDTTVRFDLQNKAALYARAGVAEYWVLDIVGRRAVVHRQPTEQGYGEIMEVSADGTISPLSRLEASVRVADLLPPLV